MIGFSANAQQVLALARREADRLEHNYVGTEHLLLGVIRLGCGAAVDILQKLGLTLATARQEVEEFVGRGAEAKRVKNIPWTPRVKKVLALAVKEAKSLSHCYVGTEHLLLGLLRENQGVAAKVLKNHQIDIERVLGEIPKRVPEEIPQRAAEDTPKRPPLVIPSTGRRDAFIAVIAGLIVLAFIGYGVMHMAQPVTGNKLTGTVVEKVFTPRKEEQITFSGRRLEGTKEIAGEYMLKVRVEAQKRTYEVPVEQELYESKKVGDTLTFLRPPSEQR